MATSSTPTCVRSGESRDGQREGAVCIVHTHELHIDSEGNLFGERLWYEDDRTGKWGYYVLSTARTADSKRSLAGKRGR
jgi:hypothetical protein